MKTKAITIVLLIVILITTSGCEQPTVNIDTINDDGKAVMALDYRDFSQSASLMVQSMLGSGAFNKPGGGRYVVTTGRILNDTMQRIDTDQLMAKIEEELLNSGRVVMTSAVGVGNKANAVDEMIYKVRDMKEEEYADEFNPDTVVAKRQLIAPELSISGKILQRNIRYSKDIQQIEYYFHLKVSDLTTGLRIWQKETIIGKRGSNKSVAW